MQFTKRGFLACSIAVASSFACSGSWAQDDALQRVLDKKSITIGIPTDYPPYGYMGPDFKPTGVDVAVAQLIADKLGVKANLMPVTTPNRIPFLEAKKIDLIVSALGKTPEREKVIDFTTSYAPFFQAVFGPKNLSVKSFDDLAGKTMAVTRGTIHCGERKPPPSTSDRSVSPKRFSTARTISPCHSFRRNTSRR